MHSLSCFYINYALPEGLTQLLKTERKNPLLHQPIFFSLTNKVFNLLVEEDQFFKLSSSNMTRLKERQQAIFFNCCCSINMQPIALPIAKMYPSNKPLSHQNTDDSQTPFWNRSQCFFFVIDGLNNNYFINFSN